MTDIEPWKTTFDMPQWNRDMDRSRIRNRMTLFGVAAIALIFALTFIPLTHLSLPTGAYAKVIWNGLAGLFCLLAFAFFLVWTWRSR